MPNNKDVMDPRAQARPLRGGALRSDERGIMIVEVLTSAVLLVVTSLATVALIDRAGALSSDNRARSVATGLAQQDQDKVRQIPFSKIDGMFAASNAVGETKKIDGSPRSVDIDGSVYEVDTELEVVADNGNENTACLAGWQNRMIQITTIAKPPSGNTIKPVQMRTFRVPTISDQANKGGVIVRLSKANGDASTGVPVRVTGKTQIDTDGDGCAVFSDVDTGSVTVSWGLKDGALVDENGATTVERTLTLLGGSTAQFSGRFDAARTPMATFVDENGNETTPDGKQIQWNSLSVVHSGISTVYNGWRGWDFASAHTYEIPQLFPFESAYGVFAGTCWGNDPTVWEPTTPVSTNWMLMNAAATGDVNVQLQTVRFTLPGAGYRVYVAPETRVTKMGNGKCVPNGPDTASDGILPAGAPADRQAAPAKTTPTGGAAPPNEIRYALPWGIWRVCVDNGAKRTNAVFRVNNTPPTTPGSSTNTFDYEPVTSYTVTAGQVSTNGTCPSNGSSWPWSSSSERLNPTDYS